MHRKKDNNISKVKNKKTKNTFLSGIIEKKLIIKPQNSILCEIADVFNDQFHYLITIKGDKLEIFYSPGIKKVTGYTAEELIKLKSLGREMVHEEDLPEVKKKLYKIENGKISNLELLYRFIRKDGKMIWLKEQIHSEEINNNKILKGVVLNVTEFKKSESDYWGNYK